MNPLRRLQPALLASPVLALVLLADPVPAQDWRLVGITGQQQDETSDGEGGFLYPDHTFYEIDPTDGGLTRLFRATFVPDSQAIGFCPDDGLLYHAAGSHSYSNNPSRTGHDQGGPDISGVGFQDGQYLEAIDPATGLATPVYNANPCPNPDPLSGRGVFRPTRSRPAPAWRTAPRRMPALPPTSDRPRWRAARRPRSSASGASSAARPAAYSRRPSSMIR